MRIFLETSDLGVAFSTPVEPLLDFCRWRANDGFGSQRAEVELWKRHRGAVFVVTSPAEVRLIQAYAGGFYVPGSFCRQSDLLNALASTGKEIFLERGPFLTPKDMILAVDKIGSKLVTIIDAGTSFGYGARVLDLRAFAIYEQEGIPFGINIGELIAPKEQPAPWTPEWIADEHFREVYVHAAFTFGAVVVVCNKRDECGVVIDFASRGKK